MNITKRQLKRLIKEELMILAENFLGTDARLSSIEDDGEFSESAIEEMQYVIEMFHDDGDTATAQALKAVLSTALQDMSAMGKPSHKLVKIYQDLDDMARGEIPYEIGSWVRGELNEEGHDYAQDRRLGGVGGGTSWEEERDQGWRDGASGKEPDPNFSDSEIYMDMWEMARDQA